MSTETRKNLIIRTISGIVFIAATFAAIFLHPFVYMAVFGFFLFCAMHEYLRITIGKGKVALKAAAIVSGLSAFLCISAFVAELYADIDIYPVGVFFGCAGLMSFLALPVINLFEKHYNGLGNAWASLLYIALPFCLMGYFYSFNYATLHGWHLASILILLWAGDVGAYCIGTMFGQGAKGHKLMPSISPKKSWEGVFGGALMTLIAGLILFKCGVIWGTFNVNVWFTLLYCIVIFAAGVFGDLAESQLKRNFGVKDSGSIMPGHGGFLDRFDSALLALPVAFAMHILIS